MAKPVAVTGEAVATASLSTAPSTQPAWTGAWVAGAVTESAYAKLTVGAKAVIHQARCTFTFTGADASGAPVGPLTSTVTLTAAQTVLQKGASSVLRHGDRASDSHGNAVEIRAAGKLRSD